MLKMVESSSGAFTRIFTKFEASFRLNDVYMPTCTAKCHLIVVIIP